MSQHWELEKSPEGENGSQQLHNRNHVMMQYHTMLLLASIQRFMTHNQIEMHRWHLQDQYKLVKKKKVSAQYCYRRAGYNTLYGVKFCLIFSWNMSVLSLCPCFQTCFLTKWYIYRITVVHRFINSYESKDLWICFACTFKHDVRITFTLICRHRHDWQPCPELRVSVSVYVFNLLNTHL